MRSRQLNTTEPPAFPGERDVSRIYGPNSPGTQHVVLQLAQHLRVWGAAVKADQRNLKVTAVHKHVVQTAVLRDGAEVGDVEGWWWYLIYPAPKHLGSPDYDRVGHMGEEDEVARRVCRVLLLPLPKGAGV